MQGRLILFRGTEADALHPKVSVALDAAQQDALAEIQRWLTLHSVTRVGPFGAQEVLPVEHMQVVRITHRTSRVGDPHRHVHMQIGTRVTAADLVAHIVRRRIEETAASPQARRLARSLHNTLAPALRYEEKWRP